MRIFTSCCYCSANQSVLCSLISHLFQFPNIVFYFRKRAMLYLLLSKLTAMDSSYSGIRTKKRLVLPVLPSDGHKVQTLDTQFQTLSKLCPTFVQSLSNDFSLDMDKVWTNSGLLHKKYTVVLYLCIYLTVDTPLSKVLKKPRSPLCGE